MQHIERVLSDGSRLLYVWFEAMHTQMNMVIWDKDASIDRLVAISEKCEKEVRRIESLASCFLNDSEVSVINRTDAGIPVRISAELFNLLSRCCRYNRESDGLFDVAVSEDFPGKRLSDKIRLDEDNTVTRLNDKVRINLSGILKGYAMDCIRRMVADDGIANGLFNFGNSSVYAQGSHPAGDGWPVAVWDGSKEYVLHDECLTTSGNDSETRMHIMDPETGRYVRGKGMVSVVTPDAETGEVKSTIAFLKSRN